MSRWVVPTAAGLKAAPRGETPDGPLGRIAKYVPGEVVSAFTVLFSGLVAMKLDAPSARLSAVALIVIFLIVTIAYIATRAPAGAVRKAHLLVSSLAFLAWAYPISSSLIGDWFVGLVSFFAQAVVIALSIVVAPSVPGGTPPKGG